MGHYRHPNTEPASGAVDEGFQGFGSAQSDAQGQLRFRTIRPVPYPGRTPHIHVKVRHATFGEVTSQLFVAGDPGNARDGLFKQRHVGDFETLLAACVELGVRFIVCEMGLRAQGIDPATLRDDVPCETAGIVTLLEATPPGAQIVTL